EPGWEHSVLAGVRDRHDACRPSRDRPRRRWGKMVCAWRGEEAAVSIRKFLLLPGLIRASVRLRRQGGRGWEQFWSGVRRTGPGGDVLWDVAERTERDWCLQRPGRNFDPALPVVDIGCGNGRFTRLLANRFPVGLRVDVCASP